MKISDTAKGTEEIIRNPWKKTLMANLPNLCSRQSRYQNPLLKSGSPLQPYTRFTIFAKMPWNDYVASQSTIPSLEQLDPWDPRWEQAFEVKMASKTQQRRDRNEDSDSIYSDDVEFVTLVDGTE